MYQEEKRDLLQRLEEQDQQINDLTEKYTEIITTIQDEPYQGSKT